MKKNSQCLICWCHLACCISFIELHHMFLLNFQHCGNLQNIDRILLWNILGEAILLEET